MPNQLDDLAMLAVVEQRVRGYLREADSERLLREITPRRPGRLSRHAAHTLLILGRALTGIGHRLKYSNQPERSPLRQHDILKPISTPGK